MRPIPAYPAYARYRSREGNQAAAVKEWEMMHRQRDSDMNVVTALAFLPGWMKYYLVPLPIKYVIFLAWLSLRRRLLYPLQKKWVKIDAKIDAYCARVGARRVGREINGQECFSMGMLWARFHGRVSPLRDIQYRWRLLRTGDVSCWRSYYVKAEEADVLDEEEEDEGGTFYQLGDKIPAPDVLETDFTDEQLRRILNEDFRSEPASN